MPFSNSASQSEMPYGQENSILDIINEKKKDFDRLLRLAEVDKKSNTVLSNLDLVTDLIIKIKSKHVKGLCDLVANHELIDHLVSLYELKYLLKSMMTLKDTPVDAGQFLGFLESLECIEKNLHNELGDGAKCNFFLEIKRLFKSFAAEIASGKFTKDNVDLANKLLKIFANQFDVIKFLLYIDEPEWNQILKDAKPKQISETKTQSVVFDSIIAFFSPKKQNSESKVIPQPIQNRQ